MTSAPLVETAPAVSTGAPRLDTARLGVWLLIAATATCGAGLAAYVLYLKANGYSDAYGMAFAPFALIILLAAAPLALCGAACLLGSGIARVWRLLGELE
ncbi:hypothetical protein [Luteimonas sp. TWI1437]|uniref:hypothetical protein n=1 Tax=unclassified Luteimonas TaxID=2629088 RepID=UPI003208DFCD